MSVCLCFRVSLKPLRLHWERSNKVLGCVSTVEDGEFREKPHCTVLSPGVAFVFLNSRADELLRWGSERKRPRRP